MLLAAGRGERLRPFTDHTPKPLVPVAGYPLIDYHLRALAAADVRRVVINLAWLGEQIAEFVGDGQRYGIEVVYSDEGDEALETGGGVVHAREWLGEEPFWVINSDVWTDYPLERLTALAPRDVAHVVLVSNPEHHPHGDFGLSDGRLRETGDTRFTFSGIGLYRHEFFDGYQQRFSLADPLHKFAASGEVAAEHHKGSWWDVGTRERLNSLQEFLVAGP
ncbi:MAG: N-acetylmuramate alpha-1-phosphate uridylyltransferase MurU [Gammaproteobacteria bacterium]